MDKSYIITQTGYRSGAYGLNAEYFTLVFYSKEEERLKRVNFEGLYGVEHRVANILIDKGYEGGIYRENFGQMRKKDVLEGQTLSEKEVLKLIKDLN